MFQVHPSIKQVTVSQAAIDAALDSVRELLAAADPNNPNVAAYGLPYYAKLTGLMAQIGYLQDYGISNEDINTLIDASRVPGLHLPPTPGLTVEQVVYPPVEQPVDPIGTGHPMPPTRWTTIDEPADPSQIPIVLPGPNPPPATTGSGLTSLPLIGPIIGQVSNSTWFSPSIVAVAAVALGLWAFGGGGSGGGHGKSGKIW